ncbi:phosphoribosylamine--glycine ligase [Cerasicoccus arenae]|uniref:Phosphoribosylamine--glycine ligase n=1 Tax=Cerasicoccus arenae TaxID=424488 RepID=A0A8J3DC57_9BACT|nr:phosphoribosylamine--glycine ligase [Cerasicoccus arenae]MBK1859834.1 phosphoribosylamine--glycine ligase [Cerasicoccus arenae]GHC08369.1 phosphoribosylamine--glycine ligase [Cerasicoccus arenae]
MKVLVIGSGGREHSLVIACRKSPLVDEIIAAPGNGGMAMDAQCRPLDVNDSDAIVALAHEVAADLVIVGPEAPLAVGAADALRAAGFDTYGPGLDGARLEASKNFTKKFLIDNQIPTAWGEKFTDFALAVDYLRRSEYPLVIKADGLAAGKGVLICQTFEEAERGAQEMLVKNAFGEAGQEILIEEFMDGEEASIMLMVSGEDYIMLPASQDHKRAGEGDTGLNTGGMGAYAPAAVVNNTVEKKVREEIIIPTLRALKKDGIDYRGTLYVGIMVMPDGQPKVVEFNVRFGDPECQILLPLLEQDPVQLILDCARGELKPETVRVKDEYAMIVVMAAGGYPDAYRKGDVISFPAQLPDNVSIVHAGTKRTDAGEIVTAGGRVLGVVATGNTLKAAQDEAYSIVRMISWADAYFRRDIGWRQLERES